MDQGWIGPNVTIQAVASDGTTNYAAGRPYLLLYAGTPPVRFPDLTGDGKLSLRDSMLILQSMAGQNSDMNFSKYSESDDKEQIGFPECLYILNHISE